MNFLLKNLRFKQGSILMLLLVVPMVTLAASEYESDAGIAAGVIGTVSTGQTYELSPSKLFSSEANFGQDLYESLYLRVKHEGSDLAIQRTVANRNFTKEEIMALIPGTNIGDLLTQPDPNAKLNPTQVEARRRDVMQQLAEEKELADLESLSTMEVQQTELFANGDESDSGFDLLVDLNIIEAILFKDVSTTYGNSGPGDKEGSQVVGVGGSGEGGQAPDSRKEDNDDAGAEGGAGGSSSEASSGSGSSDDESSVICPVNQSFHDAVARARDEERARGGDGNDGGGEGDGGNVDGGSGSSDNNASGDSGGAEKKPLEPAKASNWARAVPCSDVFCLTIEAVFKKDSSYQTTDNCVACHIEKINDSFKKTLGHSLTPSKVTGNLIEAPKCKNHLFNPKWNFILLPQPILTAPNDDLILRGDFIKNFVEFCKKYDPFNIDICKKQPGEPTPPYTNPEAEITRHVLNQVSEGGNLADVTKQISKQVEQKKVEAEAIMEKARLESEAKNQATQFQVLMQELDTMKAYFEGFNTLFKEIGSARSDAPCQMLLNKSTCS